MLEPGSGKVFNFTDDLVIQILKDSDQHPIVNIKLSEEVPCLDPKRISFKKDRPLIDLEQEKLA